MPADYEQLRHDKDAEILGLTQAKEAQRSAYELEQKRLNGIIHD